jgi:transcriptional regulator with XRE-family HTH domain
MPSVKRELAIDIDRAVGERLREIRLIRGMSQTVLGKSAHISFQQVQKYEKGLNRLSVSTLIGFCKALNVSPMEVLGNFFGDGAGSTPVDLVGRLSDAEARLKAIGKLAKVSVES